MVTVCVQRIFFNIHQQQLKHKCETHQCMKHVKQNLTIYVKSKCNLDISEGPKV